jgi:hypothetical protein
LVYFDHAEPIPDTDIRFKAWKPLRSADTYTITKGLKKTEGIYHQIKKSIYEKYGWKVMTNT